MLEHGELKMIGPTKDVADHYFAEAYGTQALDPDADQATESDEETNSDRLDETTLLEADTSEEQQPTNTIPQIRPRARLHPWFDFRQQNLGDERFGARMEVSSFEEAIRNSERSLTN